jgi:hypothetical protein
MMRRVLNLVAAAALVGGAGLVASASPAAAAGTYSKTAECGVGVHTIRNTTTFRVSDAGRVHVNSIAILVITYDVIPHVKVDWDLRIKDNTRLSYGTFTGASSTLVVENGETIRGLKTTARGWSGSAHCDATVASN